MLKAVWLMANQAYVVEWGGNLIHLDNAPMFIPTKADLKAHLTRLNLSLNSDLSITTL